MRLTLGIDFANILRAALLYLQFFYDLSQRQALANVENNIF